MSELSSIVRLECICLYKEYFGRVQQFFSVTNVNIDDNEKLTETEIRKCGYNQEMFDKEDVD